MSTTSSALAIVNGDTDPADSATKDLFFIRGGQLYLKAAGSSTPTLLLGASVSTMIIAGNGLTGGGSLAADRTLNVANADGTLSVTADDVKVGTLLAANIPANLITSAMILDHTITSADQAQMAAHTFKGNNTAGLSDELDVTLAQLKSELSLSGTNTGDQTISLTGDVTGSGAGSFAATLATVNGNVGTFGDASHSVTITADAKGRMSAISGPAIAIAAGAVSGLAAIATSGSASNLTGGTVPAAVMPALTGDVTTTAGTVATTIATNAVTNAKAAQMTANTFKGNNTSALANAADLTLAQMLTALNFGIATRSYVANGSALSNVLTEQLFGIPFTVPINGNVAGDMLHINAAGQLTQTTTTATVTVRCHVGPLGTASDPIAASFAFTPVILALVHEFVINCYLTVRTAGAGGTIIGTMDINSQIANNTLANSPITTAVAYNTTVANIFTMSIQQTAAHFTAGNTITAGISRFV